MTFTYWVASDFALGKLSLIIINNILVYSVSWKAAEKAEVYVSELIIKLSNTKQEYCNNVKFTYRVTSACVLWKIR